MPVSAYGATRYRYKNPLIFVYGIGKIVALKQVDYLSQVLEPYIHLILEVFAAATN
jgi:hypothetical protein